MVWLYIGGMPNQLFFRAKNGVKDGMKLMIEIMKLYEEGKTESFENIGGMNLGERENHGENSKNPDISRHMPPWRYRDSNSWPPNTNTNRSYGGMASCVVKNGAWLLEFNSKPASSLIFIAFWLHTKMFRILFNKNILNSCPTQDRVERWDAMKPLYYRSMSSKGAGWPCLTHHHKGWWN